MLFERHGVTNTSIQMILDESGVSKGIFYKILWFKRFVFLPFWSSVCRKT
ncbi:TetR/AcrR family transcriptional regulator [Paenibacillus sp. FSL W7-1088]